MSDDLAPPNVGSSGAKPAEPARVPPTKPKRRTTKRLIIANMIAAWAAFLLAIAMGGDVIEHVAMPMATVIVGLFGVYTGTGHLDLRAMAQILTRHDDGPSAGGGHAWPD